MQPYHFVLLLFAFCLAHAFYRVHVTLRMQAFLELFDVFVLHTGEIIKRTMALSESFMGVAKSAENIPSSDTSFKITPVPPNDGFHEVKFEPLLVAKRGGEWARKTGGNGS